MQGIGAIYESAAQFAEIREAMHEDVEYSDNMVRQYTSFINTRGLLTCEADSYTRLSGIRNCVACKAFFNQIPCIFSLQSITRKIWIQGGWILSLLSTTKNILTPFLFCCLFVCQGCITSFRIRTPVSWFRYSNMKYTTWYRCACLISF